MVAKRIVMDVFDFCKHIEFYLNLKFDIYTIIYLDLFSNRRLYNPPRQQTHTHTTWNRILSVQLVMSQMCCRSSWLIRRSTESWQKDKCAEKSGKYCLQYLAIHCKPIAVQIGKENSFGSANSTGSTTQSTHASCMMCKKPDGSAKHGQLKSS